MRLELKDYPELNRSMYVLYPAGERLSCYDNTMVTILRECSDAAPLEALLQDEEFVKMADFRRMVLLFPNPVNGCWDADPQGKDFADVNELIRLFNYQPDFHDYGIYHNMHNARYLAGVGTGASLAFSIAACTPVNVAGVAAVGGSLHPMVQHLTKDAPVSAVMWNAGPDAVDFFQVLNRVNGGEETHRYNKTNPAQFVKQPEGDVPASMAALITAGWDNLFSQVCRPNTTEYGVMDFRLVRDDYKFIIHEDDTMLGDNNGMAHTWFEYVPEAVKQNPDKKVPLVIFNHGGADTPGNMANTTKFHEVAEENGFLLVFTWCSSHWGWNMELDENQPDDIAYLSALIDHMKATYPVDETRVYMSGFSNGSAMSQVFAMTNPEKIAAVFANDTRFCQDRNMKCFAIATAKKMQYDYRMPIWYIYGSRDVEYPAVRGSGQQVAYDWWKSYNNITCKETPYVATPESCGVGVPGDVIEERYPNPQFPTRKEITHRFFSNDPKPLNLYNYTLVVGKGHDSNPEDCRMAWEYLRKFRRMPDGSLQIDED